MGSSGGTVYAKYQEVSALQWHVVSAVASVPSRAETPASAALTDNFELYYCVNSSCLLKVHPTAVLSSVLYLHWIDLQKSWHVVLVKVDAFCVEQREQVPQ